MDIVQVVADPNALTPAEQSFRTRYATGNTFYAVTPGTTAASATNNGARLAVIHESISSGALHTSWDTYAARMLVFEIGAYDRMGLSTADPTSSNFTVCYALAASPVVGDLTGSVALAASGSISCGILGLPWESKVGSGAVMAITQGTAPGGAGILWSYENGAQMVGRAAPARIVAWTMRDEGVATWEGTGGSKMLSATGLELSDNIMTWLTSGANAAPTVNAGPDQTVTPGQAFSFTATASDPDGTIASYLWTPPGGVSISGGTTATASGTAPDVPGTYNFSVTVTDDDGATASDTVALVVVGAGQVARPVGDVSGTGAGWVGYNTSGAPVAATYTTIDDQTLDVEDYVETGNLPTYASEKRWAMGVLPQPVSTSDHYISITLARTSGSTNGDARVRWYNGTSTTALAEWELTDITTTPTTYRLELTPTEAQSVNYSNIQIGVAFAVS